MRPREYDDNKARIRLHNIHTRMMNLCYTPTYSGWGKVGGIGIGVCEEWFNFKNFYNWAFASGYEYGKTITRRNRNENYTPENCKWVDSKHSHREGKTFRKLEFENQTKPLYVWARLYKMSPQALTRRLNRGWSVEDALTIPLRIYKGRMIDNENSIWE